MKRNQVIIIIALALVIAVGAGYFTKKLFVPSPPASAEAPAPFVHPIVAQLEKARKLRADGKLVAAQTLLREQIQIWRNAPEAQTARELLGDINTTLFFDNDRLFAKTEYTVKRGDSLWRIARQLESTPDRIMRANQLSSDRIHPGDRLVVPDGDFTLTLDLPNERAVVHHGDGFFKQYPIAAIDLPPSRQARLTTKVQAATWWKDGKVIPAKTPEARAESTPWIHLGLSRYTLYGISEEEGAADTAIEISEEQTGPAADENKSDQPGSGIALLKEDLAELQLFIGRGTPVTIIRESKK